MTIKIGTINETDENERRVTADSNFSQHQVLLLPSACEAAPVEGLLNDGCGSQIGQEQRSYKRCANDGFRAIENNIACNADHGQDEREHAFEGELKNFDESHDRRAYTAGPDRIGVKISFKDVGVTALS
jgi:hypothetical protein